MASLYNIEQKYLSLIAAIEEAEGEITEDIAKELAINEEDCKHKIKSYYFVIKQTEGENTVIDDEIKRLQDKKKSKENLIDRLKKAVGDALILFGDQGKTGSYKMSIDDLSLWNVYTKPVIVDEDFNNDSYINYLINYKFTKEEINKIKEVVGDKASAFANPSVDKKKLKEDLSSGVDIPKARIDNNAYYIRFK